MISSDAEKLLNRISVHNKNSQQYLKKKQTLSTISLSEKMSNQIKPELC